MSASLKKIKISACKCVGRGGTLRQAAVEFARRFPSHRRSATTYFHAFRQVPVDLSINSNSPTIARTLQSRTHVGCFPQLVVCSTV